MLGVWDCDEISERDVDVLPKAIGMMTQGGMAGPRRSDQPTSQNELLLQVQAACEACWGVRACAGCVCVFVCICERVWCKSVRVSVCGPLGPAAEPASLSIT